MLQEMGLDSGDRALIQIVDAAVAEAARKSGQWLVCRVGCTQCCIGPFPISQLDARRLRGGLAELEARDPERGAMVRKRARQSVARISSSFPGDRATGTLAEDQEAEEKFASFADDEPCPALDPETGACDLYAARPITCRTFGPPVRCGSDAVGVCELCFVGATDDEIAACEVEADVGGLESTLLEELDVRGQTIVAFALV
jgi:Fe-S-cluster containining protein